MENNNKIIIFGANGQDGFYLEQLIKKENGIVCGISRSGNWIKGDVTDTDMVERLIKFHQPDFVFHLAANSTTDHSALFENHETISTGTINILEAAYRHSQNTKIFISGSGLQFVNKGKPISESDPFEARDPYCVSRIQSVYAARYYRTLGLKVYVGYFFNHDSPLRSERHVNKAIAMAARRIASGSKELLELGDVSVRKEFTFAGDSVNAMWKLVNNDEIYEAVIGCGKAYSISDWLDISFKHFDLKWEEHVKIKSDFKSEYKILVSEPATIFSLGWRPTVNINHLAEMFLIN